MPVFVYSIAADQIHPSEGDGYVRADTIREAVALVGHPDVNVNPIKGLIVISGADLESVYGRTS